MKKNYLRITSIVGVIVLILLMGVASVRAAMDSPIVGGRFTFPKTILNATSTLPFQNSTSTNNVTDSGYAVIAGAKKVDVLFTHGGVATTSTGTTTMSVQVTWDGSTWFPFNRLVSATSTAVQIQATDPLPAATTTDTFGLDLRTDAFYGIRCIVNYMGIAGRSGEQTCQVAAEF